MAKVKTVSQEVMARYARQVDLLDPKRCQIPVYIIGAGATGSFVALALAKMGMTNIKIWDEDKVEEHNFPNQLFPVQHINRNKAEAVKSLVQDFTQTAIVHEPKMFGPKDEVEGIVISALDSMKGRKMIYKKCRGNKKVEVLIDPRTGPEMFRVISINPHLELDCKWYEKTLHSDEEADPTPCSARSIIYNVLLVSGYISSQVKKHLMEQTVKRDILLDIRNHMMYAD